MKLLKLINKQCKESGTFTGDLTGLDSIEVKKFIEIQMRLIKLGYEE